MRKRLHRRGAAFVAAFVLIAAPLAIATAAFADDPSVQSTATVANGEELREQWAIANNTLITLTANIDLGVDGSGNDICESDEPLRTDSDTGAITIDGQGLYGITQTCKGQRVLRDDAGGETVTLTGLTHFTGGNAYGHVGGLRNNGPVNVVNSTINDNSANSTGICELSANQAGAQIVLPCEDGDGGGIYAGPFGVEEADAEAGYDITLTDSSVVDNWAADDGGGVYAWWGSVSALRSQISGNVAAGQAYQGGRGGGAYADDDVTSTDSSWVGNDAQCGIFSEPAEPISQGDGFCGAVASGGGFFTYSSAIVGGSTFTNNHAYDSGGGFFADDAVVTSSTFTGNQAGGESEETAAGSASELPGPVSGLATAADGSAFCMCVGGGFAVGAGVGNTSVDEGTAQVTGSTFTGNGAGCDNYCLGGGGGFFAGAGATVSGSTFGNESEDGSNAAGCFQFCGAQGGGFYSAGTTNVDTSTFVFNGVGCLGACDAEGGGFFAGNGMQNMSADVLSKLPSGATAQIAESGSVSVVQSTFTLNEAGCIFFECLGSGGGFFASSSPTVDVTASTFNDNDSLWDGGALAVNGGYAISGLAECDADCGWSSDVTVTNSTVTGNTSGYPAAVSVPREGDTLTLVNDTIDSNTVLIRDFGTCSGLCAGAQARIQECECFGANIVAADLTSFGTDVTHPLIDFVDAEPVAAADSDVGNCWIFDTTSEGFNFSDDDTCEFTDPTDNVADGNDPMLGALADNGGPTQTMLPQPGSPLIDAIQPVSECQVDVDQRGVSRPQIKGCDTGAVEVLGASLRVDKAVTGTFGNPVPATGYSFSVSCTDGTAASLTVADATNGGSTDTVNDILPGAVCTVTEAPVVYTNPNVAVQPIVTYDPATGSPLGEGETEVVTVTNNYENVNLLGIAVDIVPKFTG
jgi:hypothetical protein